MEKITFVDLSGFLNSPIEIPDTCIFVGRGTNSAPNDVGLMDYVEQPMTEEVRDALLTVSRAHFMIGPGGYILDCISKNGTYVNDKLLGPGKKEYLNHGDVVGVGAFRFNILFDGGPRTVDFNPSRLEDTVELEAKDLKSEEGEK